MDNQRELFGKPKKPRILMQEDPCRGIMMD
jgi:hypothetical protein